MNNKTNKNFMVYLKKYSIQILFLKFFIFFNIKKTQILVLIYIVYYKFLKNL